MSDYIFRYTDNTPANTFLVRPYTVNGPMSPSENTPFNNGTVAATSITTPLVLTGKGVTDYGALVQNNLVYLAENFSNPTRPRPPLSGMLWYKNEDFTDPEYPADPPLKGLYVWDGAAWRETVVNGFLVADLNVNTHKIVNVGNATTGTDALNRDSGDLRFLQLTGGTVTGNVTVSGGTLSLPWIPTVGDHATNKTYVDTEVATVIGTVSGDLSALQADIDAIELLLPTYYLKTGGIISGNVDITGTLTAGATTLSGLATMNAGAEVNGNFDVSGTSLLAGGVTCITDVTVNGDLSVGTNLLIPSASNIVVTTGTGTIHLGDRVVGGVGTPVVGTDATNKTYVDTAIAGIVIPPSSVSDGVVNSGTLDGTGTLTLTRTVGTPVVVTGTFALGVHTHQQNEVFYDATTNTGASIIQAATTNVGDAIRQLDSLMVDAFALPARTVVEQTVPGTTLISATGACEYLVNTNALSVYVNGIKQYCNTRTTTLVPILPSSPHTVVNITAPGVYSQGITVNGTPYTMTVGVGATTTYYQLLGLLQAQLTLLTIPAVVTMTQVEGEVIYNFVTNVSGAGQTLTLATTAGQLFPSMPDAQPAITTAGVTYGYREVGIPATYSNEVEFAVAPPINSLIEFTAILTK